MIKDIVNLPAWLEVEEVMKKKMMELCFDFQFSKGQSMEEAGLEAVANFKAYTILDTFLKDIGFYKGEDKIISKRDFR